jgi:hypothetical protein
LSCPLSLSLHGSFSRLLRFVRRGRAPLSREVCSVGRVSTQLCLSLAVLCLLAPCTTVNTSPRSRVLFVDPARPGPHPTRRAVISFLLALYDGAEASDVRTTAFVNLRGLPARDLVVGEVVELRVGDKVLGNMRFVRRRPAACRKPARSALVDLGT